MRVVIAQTRAGPSRNYRRELLQRVLVDLSIFHDELNIFDVL